MFKLHQVKRADGKSKASRKSTASAAVAEEMTEEELARDAAAAAKLGTSLLSKLVMLLKPALCLEC